MAIADESVTGTHTYDGTDSPLTVATVPAGQLWYVDAAYVDDPDGSNDGFVDHLLTVIPPDATISNYTNPQTEAARTVRTTNVSANASTTLAVEAYAAAGEKVVLIFTNEPASGSVYYTVMMRRHI